MKKLVITAALLALASSGAAEAQSARSGSSSNAVINECSIVAHNQINRNHSTDGNCIRAVSSYLSGVPRGALTNDITSLVVRLAVLPQRFANCGLVATEIANAIQTAETFSTEKDQKARLLEIAATVRTCRPEITAAIDPDPSPF